MIDLEALSPEALRDIARNTSADPYWRKETAKKLLADNHPYADHPDLVEIVAQLSEKPVPAPPRKAKPAPAPELKASVTTKTMFADNQE